MNVKEARAAIEAILAAIDDDELPKFDRVEIDERYNDGKPVVWWGSTGHHLGSARRGEVREPLVHRRRGVSDAIEGEMVYRADRRLLDNGDDPTGLRLAAKGNVKAKAADPALLSPGVPDGAL